jgi:hypothetical protein
MSINTVRGEAYHALFGYIFYQSRAQKKKIIPVETMPLLEKGLDVSFEPSLTVRSVYGRYLPWLISYDPAWVTTILPKLFPLDDAPRRYSAWETYLSNQVFDDAFKMLKPFYQIAMQELDKVQLKKRFWVNPFERLAEHLIIAYAYDTEGGEAILEEFFKEAPQKYRAAAVSFAGRAYIARQDFPPGHQLPDIARLKKLWELRLKSTNNAEELKNFGWWIRPGAFDDKWMLDMLLRTLEVTKGEVAGEHLVIKALNKLAPVHPLLVAKILMLIVKSTANKNYTLQVYREEVRDALRAVLDSRITEAKSIGQKILDYLLRLGLTEFKVLTEK